jgi:hypothetical protein
MDENVVRHVIRTAYGPNFPTRTYINDPQPGTRKHLTEPLEPALILALKKILPGIEVLACQKQAQAEPH